jgi:flagellar basal-body rod modification protein FlgD
MADTYQSISSLTQANTTAALQSTLSTGDQSTLDSEAFLQLFLTELQYQDPTEPMDNAKMLEQTSQLATLQSQESQQDAIAAITETLTNNAQYQAQFSMVAAIGKTAYTNLNALQTDGSLTSIVGELYFQSPIKGGEIQILDEDTQEVVKTITLDEELYGKSGYLQFSWDGTDDGGEAVEAGTYIVKADYIDENDENIQNYMGVGKIDGIQYNGGVPYLSMGTMSVDMANIEEIR